MVSYLASIGWVNEESHSKEPEALRLTWQILCLGKQTMISKTKWGVRAFILTQQSGKEAMLGMFKKLLPGV